jgi:predicted transposase/invertase (TIGR01784 family)
MKSIDDADLMDDVFMNLVASDPDVGKDVCRTLLSVLLQKKIENVRIHAQRMIPGSGDKMRGIRLDVQIDESASISDHKIVNMYDVEPHNRWEKSFERMLRFRQAKIDSINMTASDNDFSHLPNLYMILITEFDVWGKDYMVYTIRNKCDEVPELDYNDGLRFLYFNTKGKKGGSESIRNMLKYMQDSKESSAVDDATRELDKYVSNVRQNPEVRGNYMTFGDRIDWEKELSRKEGREEGRVDVIEDMLKNGKTVEMIAEFCNYPVEYVRKIEEQMKASV